MVKFGQSNFSPLVCLHFNTKGCFFDGFESRVLTFSTRKPFQHHVYVALNWYNIKYPNKLEDFKTKDPTNCCLPRGYDLSSCRGFRCECVTWGAPRLGDASFAQLFKDQKIKLARMVNRQQCLGMVWGWFGDGLGMVWGWLGFANFYVEIV